MIVTYDLRPLRHPLVLYVSLSRRAPSPGFEACGFPHRLSLLRLRFVLFTPLRYVTSLPHLVYEVFDSVASRTQGPPASFNPVASLEPNSRYAPPFGKLQHPCRFFYNSFLLFNRHNSRYAPLLLQYGCSIYEVLLRGEVIIIKSYLPLKTYLLFFFNIIYEFHYS